MCTSRLCLSGCLSFQTMANFILSYFFSETGPSPVNVAHSQLNVRSNRIVINYLTPKWKTIKDFIDVGINTRLHTHTTFTFVSLCRHTYSMYLKHLHKLTSTCSPHRLCDKGTSAMYNYLSFLDVSLSCGSIQFQQSYWVMSGWPTSKWNLSHPGLQMVFMHEVDLLSLHLSWHNGCIGDLCYRWIRCGSISVFHVGEWVMTLVYRVGGMW